MATRRNRFVSLLAALAVGGLSARAHAIEPPPPDNPAQDTTQYELWAELDKYDDLEMAASIDPSIAQLYEDFMFDFDDGCWEEGGEESRPVEVSGAELWAEHHTRWMGDIDFSETLAPEAIPDLSAPASVAEQEVKLTADVGLAHSVSVGSGSAHDWQVHPALLEDENTEPGYPVSGHLVDTRFWEEEAASTFLDCLAESDYAAAFAFAQTTDLLVSASASGPPDPTTIEACFDEVESAFGDPCEKDTEELCLNLEWHESWCGRIAYSQNGANPSWACYDDVQNAIDDYMAESGATEEPILLPSKMYRAGEVTEHPGLKRALGVKIQLSPDTSYGESDHALPNAEVSLADRFDAASERIQWAANGQAVHSCEEFAYEYHQDMSVLLDGAKTHQRDPRWTFEAAYYGRDGVGPFVTSGPALHTKTNFLGSDGGLIWLNKRTGMPDHGFVPWTRSSKHADPKHRLRHRLQAWEDSGAQGRTRLSTFKNVYFYLHRLRKGPTEPLGGQCASFRHGLQNHYTVNAAWHKRMNETAANAGFLDEEMELMRGKQDALWTIYQQYLLADDPAVRADLTKMIDDALREGFAAGCIPNDPSVPTACDWAPSIFSEGVLETTETWQRKFYDKCADELGEAEFTDNELKAKFVDLSNANVAFDSDSLNELNNKRNAALAYPDFTGSTAGIHNYLFFMVGTSGTVTPASSTSRGYRSLVAHAVDKIADGTLIRRGEFEKTMGGEFSGTRMQYQTEGGPGADAADACEDVPTSGTNAVLDLRLGSDAREVMRADTNLRRHGHLSAPEGGAEPKCDGAEWECANNVWVNGGLTHEPGYGTTLSGGFGHSFGRSWEFFSSAATLGSVGWFTAKIRLGAGGSISASTSLQARHSILNGECTCDCSDATVKNGRVVNDLVLGVCEADAAASLLDDPYKDESVEKCECGPEDEEETEEDDICPTPTVSSMGVNVGVGAGLSGHVALGVAFAQVLEVGVRGSLTLIGVSIPASYTVTRSTAGEERRPAWTHAYNVSLVAELLSGSLSLYVALDALVTTVTLFELVIARWSGYRAELPLLSSRVSSGDLCLTRELDTLRRQSHQVYNDSCPCVLRPAGCNED